MAGIDKIDKKILAALQEDASRSAAEIAEAVGLSPSPCWRRIQQLKEQGYISRIVAILDRDKLGLRTHLFVQVKMDRNDRASLAEFSRKIREFPEVLECHAVLGVFDYLLRVITRDMDAYETFFFEKLSNLPHVREMQSFVIVTEIKSTTVLPL